VILIEKGAACIREDELRARRILSLLFLHDCRSGTNQDPRSRVIAATRRCTLRDSQFTRGFELIQPVPCEENHLVSPFPLRQVRFGNPLPSTSLQTTWGVAICLRSAIAAVYRHAVLATRSGRLRARIHRWELLNRFVQFPRGDRGILPFAVCYIAAATLSSHERRRCNTSVQRYPASHIYRAPSLACLLLAKV